MSLLEGDVDSTVLAQTLGMVSFGLGIAAFYQKNDRNLKIMMVIFNINHLIHFLLLGAMTSALSAFLSALRSTTAIYVSSKVVASLFILLSVLGGIMVAEQWRDLWPILGVTIGTYSIFCLSGIVMRMGFLFGAICWLINNILVGSIGGVLLESTLIVVNVMTMLKIHRLRATTEHS